LKSSKMFCIAEDGFFYANCINNIRNAICCMLCLVIAGPVLFIIGISILVSAPGNNTRSDNVSSMNDAIAQWNTLYMGQFADYTFSLAGPNMTQPFVPTAVSPTEASEIVDTDGVNNYKPLYYTGSVNNLFPSSQYVDGLTYDLVINATSTVAGNVNSSFTLNVPVFFSNTTAGVSLSYCTANGGNYIGGGTCTFYNAFDSICLKLSEVKNLWGVDNSYGGFGCEAPDWNSVTYKLLQYNNGALFDIDIPFVDLTVTLRSQGDPRIEAEYLTNGSLDFGLTKAQTAAIGLIIMIIGIIFMLPCCCMAFILIYSQQKRRR